MVRENMLFFDSFIFLIDERIMVCSDLHLTHKSPIFDSLKSLKRLFLNAKDYFEKRSNKKVELFVIINQMFDSVGGADYFNREKTKNLVDFLIKNFNKIVYVAKNHKGVINNYLEHFNIISKDYFITKNILFLSEDKIFEPNEKFNTIILGHESPNIYDINEKKNCFKCFIYGKYKDKNLIILPSFATPSFGVDFENVTKENILTQYIDEGNLESFKKLNIVLVDDSKDYHYFGTIA